MAEWPYSIPYDLRNALEELGRRRSAPNDAAVWLAVKEWLERHGVEAPEHDLQAIYPDLDDSKPLY